MMFSLSGCSNSQNIVTIRYAAWNLGSKQDNGIERQMIDSFNSSHPNIKVEIDENFATNYDVSMSEAVKNNNVPDVFMYHNIPLADSNKLCADITDITSNDDEWNNIPKPLKDAVLVKGRVEAVPVSMYLDGYFYNETLFESKQVSVPSTNFSVNEFTEKVANLTDINNRSIGLADESSIVDWYPSAVNSKYGWFTWDGGKLNLNSKEFIAGITLARSIFNNKETYAALTEQDKKNLKGTNDWEAWKAGTVALKFDGSWSVGDYSKLPFKVGFAGLPGSRACIVPDFLFISKNCKYPEQAYEFAKYMSAYSKDGFSKRMAISKIDNTQVSSLPMIKDKKIIDEYFSNIKIKGLKEQFSKIENNSYVEGVKILPGYNEARWNYVTNIKVGDANGKIGDVITNAFRGDLNIESVADELNANANQSIQLFPRQSEN